MSDKVVCTTEGEASLRARGYALTRHKGLLHFIDAINDGIGKAVSFLIVPMIGITIWVVILRYFFRRPFFYDPVGTYTNLLSVYIIFGAAYVLHMRSYMSVDILRRHLSPRARGIVDVVTSALLLLVLIVLLIVSLWMIQEKSISELMALMTSPEVFTPLAWPIRLIIWPVGIFLLLLQGLAKFARDLIIAITGDEEV